MKDSQKIGRGSEKIVRDSEISEISEISDERWSKDSEG